MQAFTPQDDEHEALIQFLYMAPIGLAQTSIDGDIVLINPVCAQLLMPLSRDGCLHNLFVALEPLAPDLRSRLDAFSSPQGMVCHRLHLQAAAGGPGTTEPTMLSLSLLKLDAGRLMAVLEDVTQAVKRERQLRQNEAWFNAIFAGVTDYALMSIDESGRIESWNPGMARLTGLDASTSVGRPYSVFYPEGCMPEPRLLDRLHEAECNGWSLDEGWLLRAGGGRFWGSCLIAPLEPLESGEPGRGAAAPRSPSYSLIVRDVSEKREASEALRLAVHSDHLTGLANRRAFFDAGELEVQRWRRMPRPLSVVVFDADHFKSINDTHGHAAGDELLRALGACLNSVFRGADVVARVGGEEFAALLPGAPLEGAAASAARVREQIAALRVEHDGVVIRFTVSAGVASMEPGVESLHALIKRADSALYAAKRQGRNRVETWPSATVADAS